MAFISAVALFLLGTFGAAMSHQLTDDFKAWTPWVIRRLISRALRRLPENQRERFDEEWISHINEVPGEIGKLVVAIGLLTAARRMAAVMSPSSATNRRFESFRSGSDRILCALLLFLVCPMIFLIVFLLFLEGTAPALVRQQHVDKDGCKFNWYLFNTSGRLGRFLILTSMDFLPMLLNVLRGEIRLVGPRPESAMFVTTSDRQQSDD